MTLELQIERLTAAVGQLSAQIAPWIGQEEMQARYITLAWQYQAPPPKNHQDTAPACQWHL